MNRRELLQNLIDHYNYQNYIEIGVYKGKTFLPLICRNKIAVDPAFRINPVLLLKSYFDNITNLRNKYYQMTSEKFFKNKLSTFKEENYPDLVFIDGLHTFEASLNDVLNSLRYLKPGGSIVLHDCFPPTEAAATPALSLSDAKNKNIEGWTGTWCGDVWKTISYLKNHYSEILEIKVYNADMGLGLIRIKGDGFTDTQTDIDKELFEKINSKTYQYLIDAPLIKIGLTQMRDMENL